MILRRSRFTHVVALGGGRVLILHAVTQLRLAVDGEVERLLGRFDQPRSLPEDFPDLSRVVGYDVATLAGCVAALLERGFLSENTADEEAAEIASRLLETAGRDPGEMLDRFRRERGEGAAAYWAASATRSLGDLAMQRRRLDVALLERGFLSEKTADEQAAEIASQLLETAGRDPDDAVQCNGSKVLDRRACRPSVQRGRRDLHDDGA